MQQILFMHNKIPMLSILFVSITLAFAFKPASKKLIGVQFELINSATPLNPSAYLVNTIDPITDCPGAQKICMIDVPTTDVYSSGPNVGKPKVDILTPAVNELADDILFAVSFSHLGDGYSANGRMLYESH